MLEMILIISMAYIVSSLWNKIDGNLKMVAILKSS